MGSESIIARGELLTMLMQQTARVPFDDRRAAGASNEDLSLSLAREFLKNVRSELLDEPNAERVYRAMQIVSPANGHTVPRNVALLLFSNEPNRWFRGARIEVVEFPDEAGGNTLTEKVFAGPLHHQVRRCISYLEGLTTRHLEKSSTLPETRGWVSFPLPALREAVVNAVYHRRRLARSTPASFAFNKPWRGRRRADDEHGAAKPGMRRYRAVVFPAVRLHGFVAGRKPGCTAR